MFATYFNCIAVIIGSLLGLLLRSRIRDEFKSVVMSSSGLVTLVIGMSMALGTNSYLILIFSVVIGGFVGYALHIEDGILRLGDWMDRRTSRVSSPASDNVHSEAVAAVSGGSNFAKGFLDASLLFCSGAMSVVGSIQAGTVGDYELIMVKSIMDGCMAIIFAAAYGPGVIASALFILIYQGFFTLAGGWLAPVLGDSGIAELSAVGGILLLMIGLGLTGIKEFKTGNFLPAMVVAPLLAWIAPYLSALMP
ncbi:MAG: DUF554 domain-containing protein [Sphaerochaetaceae bacterium]|jgi:uncharacterized membrane protein YqgA involved in biofilm formation